MPTQGQVRGHECRAKKQQKDNKKKEEISVLIWTDVLYLRLRDDDIHLYIIRNWGQIILSPFSIIISYPKLYELNYP